MSLQRRQRRRGHRARLSAQPVQRARAERHAFRRFRHRAPREGRSRTGALPRRQFNSLPLKRDTGHLSAAMKLPANAARPNLARFDALVDCASARSSPAAVLVCIVLALGRSVPRSSDRTASAHSSAELATLQESMLRTARVDRDRGRIRSDRAWRSAKNDASKRSSPTINAQLAAQSAGLIPPERMVQVIHDVLSRQRGVTLVSLHNIAGHRPLRTRCTRARLRTVRRPVRAPGRDRRRRHVPRRARPICTRSKALEWRFYWSLLELETHHISPQPRPHRAQHAESRQGLDRRLENETYHEDSAPSLSRNAAADR